MEVLLVQSSSKQCCTRAGCKNLWYILKCDLTWLVTISLARKLTLFWDVLRVITLGHQVIWATTIDQLPWGMACSGTIPQPPSGPSSASHGRRPGGRGHFVTFRAVAALDSGARPAGMFAHRGDSVPGCWHRRWCGSASASRHGPGRFWRAVWAEPAAESLRLRGIHLIFYKWKAQRPRTGLFVGIQDK